MEPNNGNLYYYLKDALGNIIGLAAFLDDYYYEVRVEYKYDAWGNLVETTGPLSSTVGAQNPFLYKGYYFDRETGYYYLQSRYYSPEWCRFINADDPNNLSANGDHSSVNLFAYCNNNPVIYSDPDGEIAIAIPIILKALGMAILTTLVVIAISYLAKTAAPSFSGFVNHMVTQTKRILSPVKILAIIPALLQNLQYRAITAAVRRGLAMVDLGGIARGYGNGKCVQAAKAMAKELTKRKLPFKFVDLWFPNAYRGYVLSKKMGGGKAISENGHHYGILYNGRVFCNIYPEGLPLATWRKQFYDWTGMPGILLYPPSL